LLSERDFEAEELEVDPDSVPLDRYKPIEFLGQGTLGCVYLCVDRRLEKFVAVKSLTTVTDDRVVSFQNEAKIASKLNHESVIHVLDFGITDGGKPFMVMEHFESQSLESVLEERGRLEQHEATEMFLIICAALQYLHDNNVFHRDLKPSNILVGNNGDGSIAVRLIDFNLSKTSQNVQSKTLIQGRTVVGTPTYMSPDQIEGIEYDAKSEVYSMGCVMYETLVGRPPFEGETALEVLNKHVHEEFEPLLDIDPDLNPTLCSIVENCLSKDRKNRYRSMNDLIDELSKTAAALHVKQPTRTVGNTAFSGSNLKSGSGSNKHVGAYVVAAAVIIGAAAILVPFIFNKTEEQLPKIHHDLLNNRAMMEEDLVSDASHGVADHFSDSRAIALAAVKSGKSIVKMRYTCADDDMEILADDKNLEELHIADTPVSDKSMQYLGGMKLLRVLDLNNTRVVTMKGIENCKALELLSLNNTHVGDEALARIGQLPKIVWLRLRHTKITDKGIESLEKMLKVADLDLSETDLTDQCIPSLLKHKPLVLLNLRSGKFTYEGVQKLARGLPNLDVLDVARSDVLTRDQQQQLRKEFPSILFDSDEKKPLDVSMEKAATLKKEGRYAEAITLYRHLAKHCGVKNLERRFSVEVAIAECLELSGDKTRAAESMLAFAKEMEGIGKPAFEVRVSDTAYSIIMPILGFKKAEPLYFRSIKLLGEIYGPESEQVVQRWLALGDQQMAFAEYKSARTSYEKHLAIAKKLFPADDVRNAAGLAHLAESYRYLARYADAVKYYEDSLRLFNSNKEKLSPQFQHANFHALCGLTQIYFEKGDVKKALAANNEAYQMLNELELSKIERVTCLLQRVSVLELTKKQDEIERAKKELAQFKKDNHIR